MLYINVNLPSQDTSDEWLITDPTLSRPNSYHGSAIQQAVSGLTRVPSTGFYGSGKQYVKYGILLLPWFTSLIPTQRDFFVQALSTGRILQIQATALYSGWWMVKPLFAWVHRLWVLILSIRHLVRLGVGLVEPGSGRD